VDTIKNADLWLQVAADKDQKEVVVESPEVKNLWSTFVGNHALQKQKELDKQQREVELRKKREEQEVEMRKKREQQEEQRRREQEERRRIEEERRKARDDEKIRKQQQVLDINALEEKRIEEARSKAKLEREMQLKENERNEVFGLDSFCGSVAASGVKMPAHVLSQLKKSGSHLINSSVSSNPPTSSPNNL